MLHIEFRDAADKRFDLVELGAHAEHQSLLDQIAGKDRVHKYGAQTTDELLKFRIGGDGYSKTAYAIVDEADTVESVIYGYNYDGLPGNVDEILKEKSSTPKGKTSHRAFYSISALVNGGGPRMINSLVSNCPEDLAPVTLSPLRTTRKNYPQFNAASLCAHEKMVLGFVHLLDCNNPDFEKTNDVQRFHMGNGAIILHINTAANTPDSIDGVEGYGIMPNYGYTIGAEQRKANQTLFTAIRKGHEPVENIVRLMDVKLAETVTGLMSAGVMAELYTRQMVDNLQRVLSDVKASMPRLAI